MLVYRILLMFMSEDFNEADFYSDDPEVVARINTYVRHSIGLLRLASLICSSMQALYLYICMHMVGGNAAIGAVLLGTYQYLAVNKYGHEISIGIIMELERGELPSFFEYDSPIWWLAISVRCMVFGVACGVWLLHGTLPFIGCCVLSGSMVALAFYASEDSLARADKYVLMLHSKNKKGAV
jgi:hypothetical protein